MKELELWDGRPVGDVKIFNLNKPMNLTTFDQMPLDLQNDYLEDLRDKHGARVKEIAAMLGCRPELVRDRLKAARISYLDRGCRSRDKAEAWARFTAGYQFPETATNSKGELVGNQAEKTLADEQVSPIQEQEHKSELEGFKVYDFNFNKQTEFATSTTKTNPAVLPQEMTREPERQSQNGVASMRQRLAEVMDNLVRANEASKKILLILQGGEYLEMEVQEPCCMHHQGELLQEGSAALVKTLQQIYLSLAD